MQRGPSNTFIAHKAISLCEDLSGSEKRVAATIVDHFNRKTGQCDPGLARIASLVGVSQRTVIRAIAGLARKGYIRRHRHGGKFHRNQYEPDWDRFRAMEAHWNDRRSKRVNRSEATSLSPSQRQSCHGGGDIDVTQTFPRNSTNETLPVRQLSRESCTVESVVTTVRLSKEVNRKESYATANTRFREKTADSRVAVRDVAERRWNEALMKQFLAAPDVFGSLVEAIDTELSNATTEAELRKRGGGIHFLLRELDRRFPLLCGKATIEESRAPSGGMNASSNFEPGRAPASTGLRSPRCLKSSPEEEPKQ